METIGRFVDELQFGRLEKRVKTHLQNVYATMGVALLVFAVGGYVHLYTGFVLPELLTFIGSLGLLAGIHLMSPTPENLATRFGMLMGFSFLSGLGFGPLLDLCIKLDPTIVPTAFLATSLIFICFSLSALLANDRKFLALGGILFSGLSWLCLFGLLNIFWGSRLLFQIQLYGGLLIMCGYVLYDTQLIVERCRMGQDDFVGDCLKVLIDFIDIFRLLLVLFADKEGRRDNRRRRS